jgi:hypothetical protein
MDEPKQSAVNESLPKTEPLPVAWQPFTPRGVAAFAYAGYWRLLFVQLVVGALAAGTIVWFLSYAWFPAIRQAIQNLPEKGVIVWGELNWPGPKYAVLSERRPFLIFLVDLEKLSRGNSGADLSLRFHKQDLEISSLFGYAVYPYPKDYQIEFNRVELQPRWEAWRPSVLGWTAVVTPLLLLLIWAVLASIYFPVARLIALFSHRDLNWAGSWKLCSAALMSGALVLSAAIFLYGLAVLDLFHLLFAVGLHLVIGWVYLVIAALKLPKEPVQIPTKPNPFSDSPSPEPQKTKGNPFAEQD